MTELAHIRAQFPAIDGDLVYLDSAATTQKPQTVIDCITEYYRNQNANVHRGSHSLTAVATQRFEAARHTVAQFINASSTKEIIWTRGATEALNLIAQTYARNTLQPGDEILVPEIEHHANIVPWQIVAEQTGAKVVKIPITPDCQFDLNAFDDLLSHKTKIVAVAQVTNVTGTQLPLDRIIPRVRARSHAVVVVDGAQGIVHQPTDVQALDADFYVFSGHKLYAPAGIGVLYGKLHLLEAMPPWHGGGKMVEKVSFDGTTFSELPGKFEAGTPNVAGVLALSRAIEWLSQYDNTVLEQHIHALQQQAFDGLSAIEDIRIIGFQPGASVITFVMDGVHHQDIATLLDQQNIAVRAGHHCAHPLMDALGLKGTVRASFAIYNTKEDVKRFVSAVEKAVDML
ncbi:cysteine desulfurase CsdA [Vibrio hangzhouensis]|uniref:cysteine desulfurase n=1 Tax=Vibrio hangzhouensis TaxID=462991 RepID=A0A1H6B566_9VIBR|nr:cysteine desulfurase CsdA [Vibrio hangzhouensis]SEG55762.1 cysteine sulfinate desulfinase [Vibrio hangzhouensis]